MSDIEYSDGIDNQRLRFEKTQNRDIIRTIERINRAEKFRDSANDVIGLIRPILMKDVKKIVCEYWRDLHPTHSNPNGLAIGVDLVSPVIKKIHPEGDTDKTFKMYKDYPFYYLMNLRISVKFKPNDDDQMKDNEAWYGNWFIQNLSQKINNDILKKVRDALATKFNNIFAYPSLDAENLNKVVLIEDTTKRILDRINIIATSTLKFNKDDSSDEVNAPFDYSDDMRFNLAGNIAMAFERIIRV